MSGNNRRPTALSCLAVEYLQSSRFTTEPVQEDGSDRKIYRFLYDGKSVIGVHHENVQENRDFIAITELFKRHGIPAPDIHSIAPRKTDYLLEDLGSRTLAAAIEIWRRKGRGDRVVSAYRRVLDCLMRMQTELSRALAVYPHCRKMDRQLYGEDLLYFRSGFLRRYGYDSFYTKEIEREWEENLIEPMAKLDHTHFVFRDFQSRNIMWRDGQPVFIDYQSACLGTEYYDLASMLYSSESGLEERERRELLLHFYQRKKIGLEYEDFAGHTYRFVLARRLRSLGSYGHLAEVKGKKAFKAYIAPALEELHALLIRRPQLADFSHTRHLIATIRELWGCHT